MAMENGSFWRYFFPIENGDFLASHVSLPECFERTQRTSEGDR